jgi:predicted ATPase
MKELIDWASKVGTVASVDRDLSPSAARTRLVVEFQDKFIQDRHRWLTGYDASEGALYVLYFGVLALHPRTPKCIAIDNVDQALNPRLATRLMGALCRWTAKDARRQWIVTSHNPAVLDGLDLTDPEVRLFTVDRNSKGHTSVHHIDLATALRKRPKDWTLSRMWVSGKLGGVPNV